MIRKIDLLRTVREGRLLAYVGTPKAISRNKNGPFKPKIGQRRNGEYQSKTQETADKTLKME